MTQIFSSDPRSIVDQIDVYDKEVKDAYDYYDDATSFDFGADATLKAQFLALGEGDEVMEWAIRRNKTQTISFGSAGKYIWITLGVTDNDCYSSLGHSLQIVSIEGLLT
jgi:hypothetical protein